MKSKFFIKILALVLILNFFLIALSYAEEKTDVRALFSWKSSEVKEGSSELFKTMEELNLNTVYQHFSRKLKKEEIQNFLTDAEDNQVDVTLMDGDPKWALDQNGEHLTAVVERVIEINKTQSKGINSILFDVEPYLLKEWNLDTRAGIMENFSKGMQLAYKKAHDNNIEIIICIPYYYDSMGLSLQLEELIEKGCDTVAIMNYYKKREAKHIKEEVEFAHKYGKNVINIYELKAPGTHGLIEKNTYHNDGIKAVEKSFINIKNEFPGKDISIAMHDYRSVKEVLERDRILK